MQYRTQAALDSYVDVTFGWLRTTCQIATDLIDFITQVGYIMGAEVNTSKTEGPATALVILGHHYCSQSKVCKLDPAKVIKYLDRLRLLLWIGCTTSKELQRIVGNLEFAA